MTSSFRVLAARAVFKRTILTSNPFFLTVIRCKDLQRASGNTINAYVKVAVVNPAANPADGFQRTAVHRNSNRPQFDHRFQFELDPVSDDDSEEVRRIQLAVWHRDRECK